MIDKRELFKKEETELAEFAWALSHPARLAILKMLAAKNQCVCGEIVEVLPLAQATVSQHLKELKKAGLISGTVDGAKSCYCINWKKLNACIKDINKLFGNMEKAKAKCC